MGGRLLGLTFSACYLRRCSCAFDNAGFVHCACLVLTSMVGTALAVCAPCFNTTACRSCVNSTIARLHLPALSRTGCWRAYSVTCSLAAFLALLRAACLFVSCTYQHACRCDTVPCTVPSAGRHNFRAVRTATAGGQRAEFSRLGRGAVVPLRADI